MDDENRARWQPSAEDLAGYCFHKLASLEARFIALCYRAQSAGIDCRDLMGVEVRSLDEPDAPGSGLRSN